MRRCFMIQPTIAKHPRMLFVRGYMTGLDLVLQSTPKVHHHTWAYYHNVRFLMQIMPRMAWPRELLYYTSSAHSLSKPYTLVPVLALFTMNWAAMTVLYAAPMQKPTHA